MSEFKLSKRRRAVRVVELPPVDMIKIYKNSGRYSATKKSRPSCGCVICGANSTFMAYFKIDRKGTQLMEKYCRECLHRWVIFDKSSFRIKSEASAPNTGK